MSEQYPGGFITKTAPTVSTSSAQGMWTLSQQAGYQKQGLWPVPYVPDAQFNYVTMLLHGDGTNGAQNNTFLDSSTNNFTITRNGNTTQGSFSPYGSNWSNYFDGTGDYLTAANNAALNFSTGSFTVEGWVFLNAYPSSNAAIASKFNTAAPYNGWTLQITTTGTVRAWIGTTYLITSASTLNINTWNHLAMVRNGSTVTLYINGVSAGTGTSSADLDNTDICYIAQEGGAGSINGYLSNIRIVKGTAVYTTAFTPPTAPLTAISGTSLLTCQSNRFKDNSTNNFTLTANGTPNVQRFNPFGTATAYSTSVIGGSGFLDGSGDYLNTASNAAFTLGSSGDFTVECWVYLNGSQSASYAAVMTNMLNFSTQYGNRWAFTINGLNLRWYNSAGDTIMDVAVVPYQWIHLASVRSGSTITVYVNGVAVAGQTANQAYTTEGSLKIGFLTGAAAFKGYITDARVVIGTAVYTADFTPPTAPLTAITNTTFLANTTNGAIFDNAMMNNLETVGNAQISTSVKKYGTGSLAFDGSGDWLIMPYGPTQNFGTGAFTIEGWFYLNSLAASYYVPAGTWGSGTSDEWLIQIQNNGSIRFLTTSGSTFYSAGITTATWYHIAVVRNGSTVTIYVNGTSVGSYTCTNSLGSTAKTLYIGTQAGTWDWNGYIDDFRITNGVARYTANFTPPTAAFSNTGPTV